MRDSVKNLLLIYYMCWFDKHKLSLLNIYISLYALIRALYVILCAGLMHIHSFCFNPNGYMGCLFDDYYVLV